MTTKNTPVLRFSGFTDAWEKRQLGEVVVIERGGSPRPIEKFITNLPEGLNWVKIGDAPKQGNLITETAQKIIPEGLSKTREVFPGDLILSNSMSFGKPYIMGIPGCIHDGWLLIRDKKKIFDLIFLCQMLSSEKMIEQYKSMAAGSAVNNLNKELVGGTSIDFPTLPEQTAIGSFFSQLDRAIALQEKKLENMKVTKKTFLKLMFV